MRTFWGATAEIRRENVPKSRKFIKNQSKRTQILRFFAPTAHSHAGSDRATRRGVPRRLRERLPAALTPERALAGAPLKRFNVFEKFFIVLSVFTRFLQQFLLLLMPKLRNV